jgi:hypothetical protein
MGIVTLSFGPNFALKSGSIIPSKEVAKTAPLEGDL